MPCEQGMKDLIRHAPERGSKSIRKCRILRQFRHFYAGVLNIPQLA